MKTILFRTLAAITSLAIATTSGAAGITIKPGSVASYTYVPKVALSSGGGSSGLTVAAEGDACVASNTIAITADQKVLFTCQSGKWTKSVSLIAATEGDACTDTTTVRMAADQKSLLTCQSSKWAKAGGGGLAALDAIALHQAAAGRTLTCTGTLPATTYYTSPCGGAAATTGWINAANSDCPAYTSIPSAITVTTSVSWDAAGSPSCRMQTTGGVVYDSGNQTATPTSTGVTCPTLSTTAPFSASGTSATYGSKSGTPTITSSPSIAISFDVATRVATYALSMQPRFEFVNGFVFAGFDGTKNNCASMTIN